MQGWKTTFWPSCWLRHLASSLLLLVLMASHLAQAAETTTYVLTDAQGTVLAREDAQGRIIARYDYRPYGKKQSGPATAGPGYTGHVDDTDTGLVYMQQRYYDPEIGRFLSIDPAGKQPINGLFQTNRYAYALNNPNTYIDPDGRQVAPILLSPKPIVLRASIRPTPLAEAIRQGIRNPVPQTAAERAAQLAKEAGLKTNPPPSEWVTEKQVPWTPPEITESPFKDADGLVDFIKLIAHTLKNLSGHPTVTVGDPQAVPNPEDERDNDKKTGDRDAGDKNEIRDLPCSESVMCA